MSRYAFFMCADCKIGLWLGKALFEQDINQPSRFQIREEPLNSANLVLNRVLWKMLADHARHSLRVVVEGDAVYNDIGSYAEIGGDEFKDIPFEVYLKGWSG